jgi:hypothetical protein
MSGILQRAINPMIPGLKELKRPFNYEDGDN